MEYAYRGLYYFSIKVNSQIQDFLVMRRVSDTQILYLYIVSQRNKSSFSHLLRLPVKKNGSYAGIMLVRLVL